MKKLIFLRHAKTAGNIIDSERGVKFLGRNSNFNILSHQKKKTGRFSNQKLSLTLL